LELSNNQSRQRIWYRQVVAPGRANRKAAPERLELADEVSHLMMRAVGQSRSVLHATLAEHAISEQHLVVLRHLYENGPTPMRGISALVGTDPSTVTSTVDKLEQRGLLRRTADPSDRRVKLVELTDRGRSTVDEVWAKLAESTPVGRLSRAQLASMRELLIAMVGPLPPNAPWTL
jgi:DNA-binding MarR family transcriptional regulator